MKDFLAMSATWPKKNGEIKGSLLDEPHIAQVVSLLQRNDVLVEINAIDSGLQSEADLLTVKDGMTKVIFGWATPGHPLTKELLQIAEAYKTTSLQLFIQAFMMQSLIYRVIQHSISYYARRIPKELAGFHWVIDAKDKNITDFEQAWSTVIFPSVAYQSAEKPFDLLVGGDYSYLERFESTNEAVLTRAKAKSSSPDDVGVLRLKELLGRSFKFASSETQLGLQLVDVIANAVRRALDGNLQPEGWKGIGALMVQRPLQSIPFLLLEDKPGVQGRPRKIIHPFSTIVAELSKDNKPILLDAAGEYQLLRNSRRRRKNH